MIFPAYSNPVFAADHQDAIRELMIRTPPSIGRAKLPMDAAPNQYASPVSEREKEAQARITTRDAVLALIQKPMTLGEILPAINAPREAVRSALNRLFNEGHIGKTMCPQRKIMIYGRVKE